MLASGDGVGGSQLVGLSLRFLPLPLSRAPLRHLASRGGRQLYLGLVLDHHPAAVQVLEVARSLVAVPQAHYPLLDPVVV